MIKIIHSIFYSGQDYLYLKFCFISDGRYVGEAADHLGEKSQLHNLLHKLQDKRYAIGSEEHQEELERLIPPDRQLFTFLNVRHPFTRVLSFYLEKIVDQKR